MSVKKLYSLGINNYKDSITGLSIIQERQARTGNCEQVGMRMSRVVEPTHDINEADIIWFRPKSEIISNLNYDKWSATLEEHKDKVILNHIKDYKDYDSKDRSYALWKENGLCTPECRVADDFDTVLDMLKKHQKICLRTNNEATGNYMTIMDRRIMKEGYIRATFEFLSKIRDRSIDGSLTVKNRKPDDTELYTTNRGKREDTKVIAVEYLKTPKGMKYLYRMFVVGDTIVGGYGCASRRDNIHVRDVRIKDVEHIMKSNIRLAELMEDEVFCEQVKRAVSSLGVEIGAVEFYEIDGRPHFVEINTNWASATAYDDVEGYGDARLNAYLKENRETYKDIAWPVYQHNDLTMYHKFYKAFEQWI